jgi:hypothetical protein
MADRVNYVTTNVALAEDDWRALKYLAAEYKVSMAESTRRGITLVLQRLARPRYGSPEWWINANFETKKFSRPV